MPAKKAQKKRGRAEEPVSTPRSQTGKKGAKAVSPSPKKSPKKAQSPAPKPSTRGKAADAVHFVNDTCASFADDNDVKFLHLVRKGTANATTATLNASTDGPHYSLVSFGSAKATSRSFTLKHNYGDADGVAAAVTEGTPFRYTHCVFATAKLETGEIGYVQLHLPVTTDEVVVTVDYGENGKLTVRDAKAAVVSDEEEAEEVKATPKLPSKSKSKSRSKSPKGRSKSPQKVAEAEAVDAEEEEKPRDEGVDGEGSAPVAVDGANAEVDAGDEAPAPAVEATSAEADAPVDVPVEVDNAVPPAASPPAPAAPAAPAPPTEFTVDFDDTLKNASPDAVAVGILLYAAGTTIAVSS